MKEQEKMRKRLIIFDFDGTLGADFIFDNMEELIEIADNI